MFKHKNKFLILMILMLFITISSISAQDTSNLATDNIADISTADQPTIQLSDDGSSSNVLGNGINNDILGTDPDLSFDPANNTTVMYGEAFAITITGPTDQLCLLNIEVMKDGENVQTIELPFNGNSRLTSFDLTPLYVGEYTLTINYPQVGVYDAKSYNYKIAVEGKEVPITVENVNIIYGQTATVVATGLSDIKGKMVTIEVEGKEPKEVMVANDGTATAEFEGLNAGNYTITASFDGSTMYNATSTTAKLTVDKANTTLDITFNPELVYDGDPVTFNFIVNENATGSINFKINDGTTRSKAISDGVAVYTVNKARADNYTINASYAGDNNFNSAKASIKLTVNAAPEIEVAADNITYGEDAVIAVTIPEGVTGDLTVTVGDTIYTKGFVEVDDNVYQLTISDLDAGKYDVIAEYGGLTDETSFTVDKANTTLDIIVDGGEPVYAGETVVIYFEVDPAATGTISYTINGGKTHTKTIENGVVVFTKDNVKANTYEIVASYAGDDNFNEAEDATLKLVVDVAPEIEVAANNITYGDDAVITVTIPEDVTGDLTITVGDTIYTKGFVEVDDNVYQLTISDLDAGKYDVIAEYGGLTDETSFTVDKANTTLDIIVDGGEPVYAGDTVIIYFKVNNTATGTITYTINGGKTRGDDIEEGVVVFTKTNVKANNYTIVASYSGDDNFNSAEASIKLTVDVAPEIEVTAENITYGDVAIIVVTLPSGAVMDDLTVSVNGTEYDTIVPMGDDVYYVYVPGLGAGVYDVEAEYDDLTDETSFTVEKANTTLDIIVDGGEPVYAGDAVIIYFTVNNTAATGTITYTITPGKTHTKTIEDGVVVFTKADVAAGEYEIVASYSGDDNFTESQANLTLTVGIKPEIFVTADNITYGDIEEIAVILPTGSDVNDLTIIVNNQAYGPEYFEVINDIVYLYIPDLEAGDYNVKAELAMGPSSSIYNTTEFTVSEIEYDLLVTAENITYGNNATIIVTLGTGTADDLTIIVNNQAYGPNDFEVFDDIVYLEVPDLEVGEYIVEAQLATSPSSKIFNTTAFTVSKANSTLEIEVEDIYYVGEEVIIEFDPSFEGDIVVLIGDDEYELGPDDYSISFPAVYGDYYIVATLEGDENHNGVTEYAEFTVLKYDTELVIGEIYTNDSLETMIPITIIHDSELEVSGNLTITVISGDLIVDEFTSDNFVGDEIEVNAGVLEPGDYTFVVTYNGNENYETSFDSANYTVPTTGYELLVSATNITYNESEVLITVTLPYGAFKEDLQIIVNNSVYKSEDFVQIDNFVYLNVSGLNAGRYDVEVQFRNGPSSLLINTTEFYVFKAASTIEIEVDSIYFVDDEIIITLIPSTDSEIAVYVNNIYCPVEDNTVTLTGVYGNYTVEAILYGDENHNDSEWAYATFDVYKIQPEIYVDYFEDYRVGTDVNITVYGPDDRESELVIFGDFNAFTNAFNGTFPADFGYDVAVGEYTVNITYYGNDKYERYDTSVTFYVIDREDTILTIDSITTNKTSNVTSMGITITDADKYPFEISGNVTVNVYNNESELVAQFVSEELEDCSFTFELGVIDPGEYTFEAVYSGNTDYKGSNASKVYEVPLVSNYNIYVIAENITYNNTAVIYVVLPDKADKENLKVIVNKTVYTSEDFDEMATVVILNIDGLNVGEYDVTAEYVDDVYGYLSNSTSFTVDPAESSIEIVVDEVYFVDDEITIILIPSIDDGEIIVYINGEEQLVIDNTVTLTAVYSADAYIVQAYLIGDKNHNDSYDEAEFTVSKLDPEIYADYEFEYMVGTEAYITIYGPADRNGTMLIYGNSTDITFTFDGEYRFSLGNDSEIGDYKFSIMYLENDKYNVDSIDVDFSVIDRYDTELTIDSITTDKTNNVTSIGISITDANGYPFEISGNVTVFVYDEFGDLVAEITSDVYNCKPTIDLGVIDPGNYDFEAVYNGNTYYKDSSDIEEYEVPLVSNYELPVYAEDIIYDEVATIYVVLPDMADKEYLTIIVDKTVYTSEDFDQEDDTVILEVYGLDAGDHSVKVQYKDDVYDLKENETSFYVDLADSSIEIEVDEVYFVDDEITIILIPSIDDGEITVYINGEEQEVIDNTVTLTAVFGNYTVEAFLSEDDNHYGSYAFDKFEVLKLDPEIDADYELEYMVGTEVSITVYGPADRNGTILITGNFTKYTEEFNGNYTFVLSDDAEIGDYTITIAYYDNDKYEKDSMDIYFTVIDRYDTELTIDSITTDKTNNVTTIGISITDANGYPFDISGNVTVFVYDEFGDLVAEITSDVDNCKPTIDLGEIDPGNYEFEAVYNGNTYYKDSSDVKDYEVPLVTNYELPVYARNIIYNETPAVILVVLPDRADKEHLSIIVNNVVCTDIFDVFGNLVAVNVTGLDVGEYTVKVQYKDDVYDLKENTTSFTVSPAASSIEIEVDSVYYVDDEVVITLIPSIDDGEIIVYINGEEQEVIDNTVTLTAVYGNYTVEAYLIGDKNHNDSEASAEFTVLKLDPEVSVNFTETHAGYNIPAIVTLPEDATGLVFIEIDGNIYAAYAKNGTANITIPSMDAGNYTAVVTYQGDDKYNAFTENMTLDVENYYELNVPDVVKYYHGGERLYVYVLANGKPAAEETVTIIINGVSYTKKTDKNGMASLAINLNSGNYSARVKWNDLEVNSTVEVKPTIVANDVAKVFKNDTQYYATFYDSEGNLLTNKVVSFNINGVFYNRTTDENGVAKLNINLSPGEYIITAINPVTQSMASNNVSVLSHFIEHDDLEKIYGSATPFIVRLCNDKGQIADAGELVKFNINGVMYEKRSDIDGYVKLNINLQPGQYIITSYYKDEAVSNIITVRSE